jgi:hypothetical protein
MFSIYVPKGRGEATSLLRRVGAEWALDGNVAAMGTHVVEGGPDGAGGMLVHFDPRGGVAANQITKINLELQDWEPAAPCGEQRGGRYWLGLWKDHRPGPEDLQRQDLADGLPVKLLDGNQWVVAIADYLPKLFRLDRATGEQKLQPLPADMPFIEKTNALFEYLTGDEFHGTLEETMTVMIPNGLTYAAEALSKNYRVNFDLPATLRASP